MDMLACGGQQGELHLTTLPPPASEGWGRSESTMQRESGGWRNRSTQSHDPSSSASWSMTATLPHASINNSFVLLPPYSGDTPLPTRPGSPIEETTNQGSVYQGARDGAGVSAPVATFPNSLPRGSRVRRYSTREYHLDDARRPSAFSNRSEDLTDDSRRSSDGSPAGGDDGMSFLNTLMHASSSANPMDPPPYTLTTSPDEFMPRDPSSTRPRINRAFRGRTHSEGNRTAAGNSPMTFDRRRSSNMSNSIEPDIYVHASGMATFGSQTAVGSTQPYTRHPPPSWYSHLMIDSQFPQRRHPSGPISLPISAPRGDPRLLVSNNDHFVKLFALRAPRPGAMDRDGTRESDAKFGTRRLTNVGGVKINTAANHSSLSPDGKTMICVGDNHELYLYEVISGGVDFRLIRTYRASDDAGFSTSWSKDGKKFAVASQDGVVTVWDHRSSDPLAKLFTRTRHDFGRFDYEDSYYWRSASSDGSRRDPARVVKFSPPGSSRDLLVFSEEGEAIHIVDARTFDVQSRVELPIVSREERIRNAHHSSYSPTRRMGPDGGRVGIAGIAFDPTGDFLYAGTEAVMVEYDLRRHARRGLGSWVLA
ncbi:hypothetical protein NliqN6_1105 [Naganishia liquefaciens]|uniref:DUF2415 domain-containing protein n=1 Tax=Naganishia liquefaciens TaxID=104408 RepID=A0A8H3TPC1_9TREE|nr:hypothetical protein NliqN6_1105 [Naganishia liquefaciens]